MKGPGLTSIRGWILAAAVVACLAGCSSTTSTSNSSSAKTPASAGQRSGVGPVDTDQTWLSYHADPARTGAVPGVAASGQVTRAWSVDLGGVVHGQPVAANGRLYAATENNRVVALAPDSGKVLWSVSLGKPLTNVDATAGCGNIDPLGITSTPVVDAATGIVYVVGEISDAGDSVHHQLVGLDGPTGKVVLSDDVDPPLPSGERSIHLLQRASLALANGRVYVGYGGNDGDCGHYHGWVVAVSEHGNPQLESFEVASDGEGGAIWESGGAPAIDSAGNLYVTTGNANPDPPQGGPDPKKYTESVVKLSPQLKPLASYKDVIAGGDEDLATGNPVLLPGGEVFAVGKTDVGYVLKQSDLTEVARITDVCGSDPDGGPAYDAAANQIFIPCKDGGIQEIDLTAHKLGRKLTGANGPPIIVGQQLWAVSYPEGRLFEYDIATGRTLQTARTPTTVSNFTSPSAALGLLLIGTSTGVTAFG